MIPDNRPPPSGRLQQPMWGRHWGHRRSDHGVYHVVRPIPFEIAPMSGKPDRSSPPTPPLALVEEYSAAAPGMPQGQTVPRPPGEAEQDRTSCGRRRKRSRAHRRFLGCVTDLEHRPLLSGMLLDGVGLNFIAAHELGPVGDQAGQFTETAKGPVGGFAAAPYTNPAGNAVIGYGHLLHDGPVNAADQVKYPSPISQAEADKLLDLDTAVPVAAVNNDVKVVLTQDQFDAIVDFTYNEGANNFAKSTLLTVLNNNAMGQVPAQLERWVYGKINGVEAVIPGLVNRRNDESNLFEGRINQDSTGNGPATGFSSGHPGNTFGGIHTHGCSPGSGETGTGGGAGNVGGGGQARQHRSTAFSPSSCSIASRALPHTTVIHRSPQAIRLAIPRPMRAPLPSTATRHPTVLLPIAIPLQVELRPTAITTRSRE